MMKFLYGDVCLYSNRQLDSKRPYIEWTHKRSRSRRLGITSSSFGKDHIGVFLDVGCGTSSFLNNCYQLGWDVWGVDIDPSAIAHQRAECPEGKFFASAFLDAQLPEDHFDFVSFWSYFEHEQEQTASLSKARKCLKQGGLLVIEVPDVGGRLVGFSGRYWPYWDPPFHVVHHGTRSLQRLLDKSGFKVVSTQKHGTSPLYFKYSPLLLCAFTALQRSYNSKAMDVLVSGISRATLPLEEILGLAGKLVVVAAKSD
ncbi:MAG: class I SAM-dependent methyltransferase [Calditrichaeota bacterium]|nr:class I SAM-dependent methyltransferase [Calditrichota bacterium]